jgi:hypothetical protein
MDTVLNKSPEETLPRGRSSALFFALVKPYLVRLT